MVIHLIPSSNTAQRDCEGLELSESSRGKSYTVLHVLFIDMEHRILMTEDCTNKRIYLLIYSLLDLGDSSTLKYSVQSPFCEGNIGEDTSDLRQISSPYLGIPPSRD